MPLRGLRLLGCTGGAWHVLEKREFLHCLNMGKLAAEIHKFAHLGWTRVQFRLNNSACGCPIGTGQTLACRELHVPRDDTWHVQNKWYFF